MPRFFKTIETVFSMVYKAGELNQDLYTQINYLKTILALIIVKQFYQLIIFINRTLATAANPDQMVPHMISTIKNDNGQLYKVA